MSYTRTTGITVKAQPSTSDIVVLSLVAEKIRYGYEIEKVIEERGMRNWTEIGFSSIYNSLSRLEKIGLLKSRIEFEERGRPRRTYEITSTGEKKLKEEIIRFLSIPKKQISQLDLGIANIHLLSKLEALQSLEKYLKLMDSRIKFLEERMKEGRERGNEVVAALFERPLACAYAERGWLSSFIERIRRDEVRWRSDQK